MKKMNIENYDIHDVEFHVGEGENLHRVFAHTIESNNGGEWHTIVVVYNEKTNIMGSAIAWQHDEWQSAYAVFCGAYRTACRQVGINPCCE